MNIWNGIGRLTKEPEVRYNGDNAVTRFTLAIDSGYGDKKTTDFIPIVVFGKSAENCQKYLRKGSKAAVTGRIHTDSYTNKDGKKVYTTDVIANSVEFLDSKTSDQGETQMGMPTGMTETDSDLPF